ncbi:unnamed protein product [Phytomonas sp. Hart1]|nr:unnamed protein product [Phytomonas sp. Hart1]|eukprot:CCW66578.1 unnamed protein product [Phytomonas sp. isolate Hart1]
MELLSPELPQRLAQLPPYKPQKGSGLLGRIIYPPSVYSPHRSRRDPLDPQFSASRMSPNFYLGLNAPFGVGDWANESDWEIRKNGLQYYSTLDTYEVMDCEPGREADLLASRPDLIPFKEEELQAIFHNYK